MAAVTSRTVPWSSTGDSWLANQVSPTLIWLGVSFVERKMQPTRMAIDIDVEPPASHVLRPV